MSDSMNQKEVSLDEFKNESCKECRDLILEDDCNTTVCGRCASADGCNTKAFGDCSHAEGCSTKAVGDCSHSEGNNTTAGETNSHAEGCATKALGNCSHSEGNSTIAYADSSHAEGYNTKTRGNYSHAEGYLNEANGETSHAQGVRTKAEGYASFSEGGYTTARGDYSSAEGYSTTAEAFASHSEGDYTSAKGSYSHAEGYSTTATGSYSHAEGGYTTTEGYAAHAEGYSTAARAPFSHSEGYYTDTKAYNGAHIMGLYGDADTAYSWFLGGGTSSERALAAKILYTGDAYIRNAWYAGGTDYAEMFKSVGGVVIDPGYFVTLEGELIRIANENDKFILGVTSVSSGFVANNNELGARESYLTSSWGKLQYEEVIVPEKVDKDGNVLVQEHTIKQPILGASQSTASSQSCGMTAVAILGQVLVRDDGTCLPNGYCLPNSEGIATNSSDGYRVMKRVSDNQVLIFFRG